MHCQQRSSSKSCSKCEPQRWHLRISVADLVAAADGAAPDTDAADSEDPVAFFCATGCQSVHVRSTPAPPLRCLTSAGVRSNPQSCDVKSDREKRADARP